VAKPCAHRFTTTTIGMLQPIVTALNKVLDGKMTTDQFIVGTFNHIKGVEKAEGKSKQKPEAQTAANDLCQALRKDLTEIHDSLAARLNGIMAMINLTLETAEKMLKASEDLKGGTKDLICKVGNVTNMADKIASTTQSYRDTLVARQAPSSVAVALEPELAESRAGS